MKTGLFLALSVLVVLVIGLGLNAQKEPNGIGPGEGERSEELLILELFTSQGCSSCPPAESVLSKIAGDSRYATSIVPLAFHVDYWDHLGWQDPFSSTEWTERQASYREAFGGATLYTPQIVIHGQHELVGSNENGIKRSINHLLKKQAKSPLDISINQIDLGVNRIKLNVLVTKQDPLVESALLLMSAIYENIEVTKVKSGENAGRTLSNNFVVRTLNMDPIIFGEGEDEAQFQVSLLLESDWQAENLGIVSWIQDARSMKIYRADVLRELDKEEGG